MFHQKNCLKLHLLKNVSSYVILIRYAIFNLHHFEFIQRFRVFSKCIIGISVSTETFNEFCLKRQGIVMYITCKKPVIDIVAYFESNCQIEKKNTCEYMKHCKSKRKLVVSNQKVVEDCTFTKKCLI